MKILVTGAGGFFGKNLCRILGDVKTPSSKELDVLSKDWFEEYPEIDTVIHMAAKTHPGENMSVNTIGTKNVADFCKLNGAKLIFTSTNVYGIPNKLPIKESHPLNPTNPYTRSKLKAEQIIHALGLNAIILRFTNIYGPGQKVNIIPSIIAQLKNKTPLIKLFNPDTRRDFLYVDDAVSAIHLSLSHEPKGVEVFNVGYGKSTSIRELVEIMKTLGWTFSVKYELKETSEPKDLAFDCTKAKEQLNWQPKINIKDGLKITLTKTL